MKTQGTLDAIVSDVKDERPATSRREDFAHHPIYVTVHEAAHLRDALHEGASPATPATLTAVVLTFIVPFAAMVILLAFVIAQFA